MTRCDCVWVPRHLIRAPAGVPGPPPAHVASRASPLPPLAPPQGAAPAAAAAAATAVRSPAPLGRACAGRQGECGRLAGNPAPPLRPPWLDTPLDNPEWDIIWGRLLPGANRRPRSWTPLRVAHGGSRCPQRPQCASWPRALGALWGALGAAQVGRATAAPAGDPDFGPLVALGRKFPDQLPGSEAPPVLGPSPFLRVSSPALVGCPQVRVASGAAGRGSPGRQSLCRL